MSQRFAKPDFTNRHFIYIRKMLDAIFDSNSSCNNTLVQALYDLDE